MIDQYLELLPPEGDPSVGLRVFEIVEEICKYKEAQGLPKRWNRNYELTRSDRHWKGSSADVSPVVLNLLHTHKERIASTLTSSNPTFEVRISGEVENPDIADDIHNTCDHFWRETEQQDIFDISVRKGETYGVAIEKVSFNPELEGGLGDVEVSSIDPFHFGVYPPKCLDIQKAEAVAHYYPITVRQLKRMYPDFALDIKSDKELIKSINDTRTEAQDGSNSQSGYFARVSQGIKHIINQTGSLSTEDEETILVEIWVKDYSTEQFQDSNDTEETLTVGTKPKYPGFIRCVTCCNGGKLVLSDKPNPSINPTLPLELQQLTYLYDKFPFSVTASVKDIVSMWGVSDFEHLSGLQKEIDKTITQATLYKDKATLLKIANPKTSGVTNSELNNLPGIINPSSLNHGIGYIEPPKLNINLLELLNVYKDYFYLVSGAFDLEQADMTGNVIAYKAIAALLERAALMLKGKVENYSKMIRERGRMVFSNIQNWYTEDRWITVDDGDDQTQKAIRGPEMIVPMKLTVVSGSTMPKSKVQFREESIELFKMGSIDDEALLKALDYDGRKDIIKRKKEGIMGDVGARLSELGAPPELIEYMSQIGTMDPKNFEWAVRREEIPPFDQILQGIIQQGIGGGQGPNINETAEAELKKAQTKKIMAETALVEEEIRLRQAETIARKAGVDLDYENMKLNRAKLVKDVVDKGAETNIRNKEVSLKASTQAKPSSDKIPKRPNRSSANPIGDMTSQGPYREAGMESNNIQ